MRSNVLLVTLATAALFAATPAFAGYGECRGSAAAPNGPRVDVTLSVDKAGAIKDGEMLWLQRPGDAGPWLSVSYAVKNGVVGAPTRATAGAILVHPPGLRSKHLRVIASAGRSAWRSPALPIVPGRAQDTYVINLPLNAPVLTRPARLSVTFVGDAGEILERREFDTILPSRQALFQQAHAIALAKARDPRPCERTMEVQF
jgi:hypothetical protein